jgi:hypothetical protein
LWGAKIPSILDTIKNLDPTERIMALVSDEGDPDIGVNLNEKTKKGTYRQPFSLVFEMRPMEKVWDGTTLRVYKRDASHRGSAMISPGGPVRYKNSPPSLTRSLS